MVDKFRRPTGSGGGEGRQGGKGESGGRPQRPARLAGQPVKGPARPRKVGGIDLRALEVLEREGLLNEAGRKLRFQGAPPERSKAAPKTAPKIAPRTERQPAQPKPVRPVGQVRPNAAEAVVAERLHKVMAQSGLASRRHSEELIQAGRVTVNGKVVTELGTKVVPGKDVIEVDGRPLGKPEQLVYILLNKPKGYVTTLYDPQGRPKVTDLLGEEIAERVYPVGRLDYDTEGLLLLTNDGELANAIMHPARQVKKTYIAKVRGVPGPAKLKALEQGVTLEDGPTAPADVRLIETKGPNAATVSIRIHEGRNRQVRRMFEAVGHEVIHLKRTTLGPLHLKDLEVGQWRELGEREVADLRKAVGLRPLSAGDKAGTGKTDRRAGRRGAARFERPERGVPGPAPKAPVGGSPRPEAKPRGVHFKSGSGPKNRSTK